MADVRKLVEALKVPVANQSNPYTRNGIPNVDLVENAKFVNSFMPISGDIQSGVQAISDVKKKKYVDALLNGVGLLPFVPSLGGTIKNASKYVMDEAGKPLTLYHGGPKFEGQFKTPEHADKGIYFTDNPYLAQDQFALQHELAMRDKNGVGYNDVPEHMLNSGEWDPKYFKFADVKKVNLKMNNPKIMDSLDAKAIPNLYGQGHDGFIVKSTGDFGYKGGQYVVLDPNQIEFVK